MISAIYLLDCNCVSLHGNHTSYFMMDCHELSNALFEGFGSVNIQFNSIGVRIFQYDNIDLFKREVESFLSVSLI